MTTVRRWRLTVLFGVLALGAVTACAGVEVKDDTEPLPSAASKQRGVEVWDLRGKRPAAEEVGIAEGENTSIFESRPSRPVRLRLTGSSVEVSTRYIAFSTLPNTNRDLTSIDLKTAMMPLNETVTTFESALDQLGHPNRSVAKFERGAKRADGYQTLDSDRIAGTYGDLELGVVAHYSPHSESGYVAVIGGWLGTS